MYSPGRSRPSRFPAVPPSNRLIDSAAISQSLLDCDKAFLHNLQMRSSRQRIALLGLTICCGLPAAASVIASTVPNGPFPVCCGLIVQAIVGSSPESVAAAFTPNSSVTLRDIMLALYSLSNSPSMTVAIAQDVAGLPGPIIATLTQNGLIPAYPQSGIFQQSGLVTFTCGQCPVLQAGTRYWIVGAPVGAYGVGWLYDTQVLGKSALSTSGSANGLWSAGQATLYFQIDGDQLPPPTPQPSSFLLTVIGLLGVWVYTIRNKRLSV
jgi:hypothetical protein